MTRVAYICADPGVPVFGRKGSSIHVQEVIRALIAQDARIELFATRRGGDPPLDMAAITCFALPAVGQGSTCEREKAGMAANRSLRELLRARGPYDLIYERYSLWSHAAIDWARAHAIPSIVEVNAPLIDEQAIHRSLDDRGAAEASARALFTWAGLIIAVSSEVAAWLERFGVDRDKVRIIPNGVDAGRFAGVGAKPAGPDFTVGFVGTLKPWHGLETLIAAAAMALGKGCPVRLLIVGDGPERGAIEAQLGSAGLVPHAELTGAVDPTLIPALLARMDVATAPYPDVAEFYFSPLKIVEYMGAGVAIAASRIGDIDGLIEHEVTGLLCPPGNAAALADALVRLHAEPATRVRLGAAARVVAKRDLGWDRVAREILAFAARESLPVKCTAASC